ncbi:MAG: hypothetical protein JW915_10555 [Chitinispirillaceae bacterium]|nr:hypothetical protein [Chitinispirillaceae bacterium]
MMELTKTKLLKRLQSKPIPSMLFKDQNNGKFYMTHYEGMGEHFAVDIHHSVGLIESLLSNGTLNQTSKIVRCREMLLIEQEYNAIRAIGTTKERSGFSIEL